MPRRPTPPDTSPDRSEAPKASDPETTNPEASESGALRPGGPPPEPRGQTGADPAYPEPAGTLPPVTAPALPALPGEGAQPAQQASGPEEGRPGPGASVPVRPAGLPAVPVRPPARPPGAARPSAPPRARLVDAPGGDGEGLGLPVLSRQDFVSGSDVRWCPGCGDYAVLAAVQRLLPELVEKKENVVFVSGIGCSSRFPYYMNTYGFHTIHGRAPTVATGLKASRPELDVWIITGDGDALSIGAAHTTHLLRRNLDARVLLFNNQIYGLTKGQYSPTSEFGKVTKSTPYGSVDHPFNPAALALGADGSFIARTLDRDPKHMQDTLRAAHAHRGTAFVEIYQNCNIFNDGAFFAYTEKDSKPAHTLFVEAGKPLVFDGGTRGLRLEGLRLRAVDFAADGLSADDCLVYDPQDKALASLLIQQTFWDPTLPRPFGVLYRETRPTYDALLNEQVQSVREQKGPGRLHALLHAGETWTIEA